MVGGEMIEYAVAGGIAGIAPALAWLWKKNSL